MAGKRSKTVEEIQAEILVADDGTILEPPIAELYAMGIADGHTPDQAWDAAGGARTEPQRMLRGVLDTHPDFKARVDALAEQREAIHSDRIFGPAIWMIEQGFREARAKRIRQDMLEYAKLRMQAAQGQARLYEKTMPVNERPANEAKPSAAVGKPSEKSPQSTRNPEQIRRELLDKGLKIVPKNGEEDE